MRRSSVFVRAGAASAAVLSLQAFASPAAAATVSFSGNATLASGSGRAIAAAWGDSPRYNVNFQCGMTGCSNFVSSSTTTTSLSRYISLTTCTGKTVTHSIKVVDSKGGSASAASKTTWTRGSYC